MSANPSTTNSSMKSNSSLLPVAAVFLAGLIAISGAHRANAQGLDPQTGMPVFIKRSSTHFDPASGLPGGDTTNAPQKKEPGVWETEDASFLNCVYEVDALVFQGRYEEALQDCLAYQSQPKTENHAQMLFDHWAKLGRHYPPAEHELRKVRDDDIRQLSNGGGSLVLFSEVVCLNRELHDETATCTLFKQIANANPALSGYFYPVAEDALMGLGEYPLCLSFTGDPQARFEACWHDVESHQDNYTSFAESAKNFQPPLKLPNPFAGITNTFVGQTCNLMEILLANGDRAQAEAICHQAMARVDDPRLSRALSTTEQHIKKHGMVFLPPTGLVLASATPTEVIRFMPPFTQVSIRIARGEYDQALRLIQAFCQQPNFPVVAVVLPDWMELARIYPPAMQTMLEVRERDTHEFEQAKGGFNSVGLFLEARLLNDALGETNATYVMCQHIAQHNPAQFQASFYLMEPLLMQHGDYQLCLKGIGDPQANLEMMRTNLEFMRKVLPSMRENEIKNRQQTEKTLNKFRQFDEAQADQKQQFDQESLAKRQQSRQELWAQLRTNTPDADDMPLSPPPNFMPIRTNLPTRSVRTWQPPPAIDSGLAVTNSFVNRVCVFVDVLVAAGHKADAEKIRDLAVAMLDDPRLHSAVTDAEQKIKK